MTYKTNPKRLLPISCVEPNQLFPDLFFGPSRALSHDVINRYLQDDNVRHEIIWEQVKGVIETDPDAFLVFDDSVTDKNYSHKIWMVRLQYSGNAHGLIKGIGVVNCLYVNPKTQRYWIIDWRVFDPENDAKSKLTHMQEIFDQDVQIKKLPFRVVSSSR